MASGSCTMSSTGGVSKKQDEPTTEDIYKMLTDVKFQTGPRPKHCISSSDTQIFKETVEETHSRRPWKSDCWKHSGGIAASLDLPVDNPVVRQRFGSVTCSVSGEPKFRFRRYTMLVAHAGVGGVTKATESKAVSLFYVMPIPIPQQVSLKCTAVRGQKRVRPHTAAAQMPDSDAINVIDTAQVVPSGPKYMPKRTAVKGRAQPQAAARIPQSNMAESGDQIMHTALSFVARVGRLVQLVKV